MSTFSIRIAKIEPQRDQFLAGGKIIEDVEFYSSTAPASDVHAFKRFVIHCRLAIAGSEHAFKLILNARSNIVRVIAPGVPVGANMIGQAIVETLCRFQDIPNPPIIFDRDGYFEFVLENAMWACAVLHDLRDHGEIQGRGTWTNPNLRFRQW